MVFFFFITLISLPILYFNCYYSTTFYSLVRGYYTSLWVSSDFSFIFKMFKSYLFFSTFLINYIFLSNKYFFYFAPPALTGLSLFSLIFPEIFLFFFIPLAMLIGSSYFFSYFYKKKSFFFKNINELIFFKDWGVEKLEKEFLLCYNQKLTIFMLGWLISSFIFFDLFSLFEVFLAHKSALKEMEIFILDCSTKYPTYTIEEAKDAGQVYKIAYNQRLHSLPFYSITKILYGYFVKV